MRVSTGKPTTAKRGSKKSEKPEMAMLATCPTGGGGWCSYPFTAKQLAKRMQAKAKLTEIDTLHKQTANSKKATKNT